MVINVEPSVPDDRALDVNLSYMDVISGTTEMRTITVPAGSTSQSFQIFVGDDDIAAQPTREFRVSLEQGDGYVMGAPSFVAINVLDDDVATVSISSVKDRVTEGDTIVFTVTLDLATAQATSINLTLDQASSISLTLTHNGDFFSPRMDTLNLTSDEGINLNLTGRHKIDGKLYYYLDSNPNNFADDQDSIDHNLLDDLLNGGEDTVDTTYLNGHNGSDDERSVIIDGYALVLPTAQETQAFFRTNGVPDGWTLYRALLVSYIRRYWSASYRWFA